MEAERITANPEPSMSQRLLSAMVPVLFIAITYVDPGKWAAAVEGGARFGYDLIILMLVFNFAAILCQYLSASIAVVTGKDLAQICIEEYDNVTCIFLGIQAELSMIALDLSMILGTAHGLNLIFGMDLFTCVLLTSIDAFLFPLASSFLVNNRAKFLCVCLASFVLLTYLLGVLMSQPEIPLSVDGTMLAKLSGESAFALMSLLGSNIMPHNFYLHSSIVQLQERGITHVSKGALCNDHFFAILCIFSGIFLVNYVLMNSAANVFYSTGLVLLTFQDALALMDQVFKSLVAPFALILVLLLANHTTALTWKLGGQVVLHNFFKLDLPAWLHHSLIRFIAIIPALCCVWSSGAEGSYQLLIFTQIMVALLLPSSVIPLFRVTSSRSVMGVHKITQFVEYLVLITFIGMLGIEITFVIEMIFGNSDWASNLRCNMGSSISVSYIVLLITALVSLCLMLWLAATPLKSASLRSDALAWNWDVQASVQDPSAEKDENDFLETRYRGEDTKETQESTLTFEKPLDSNQDFSEISHDFSKPEVLLDSDSGPHLATIEEHSSDLPLSRPSECQWEESATMVEMVPASVSVVSREVSDGGSLILSSLKTEQVELVEKTLQVEGDLQIERDSEGNTLGEHEESPKVVLVTNTSLIPEGPGSFRSLSGKSDDTGSGSGSLSKLAGLGRAAKRQLATHLDEFWGQLFDSHGQPTQEAKTRKLDELLGIDTKTGPKLATATPKADISGYVPSMGGRETDSVINSSLYESPRQQRVQSTLESSYGVQRGPTSFLSSRVQLLDAFGQNSSSNMLDCGERRYSSLRLPPSSGAMHIPQTSIGYDDQPATIHGYQIKSLINRMSKERSSSYLNNQMEPLAPPKSPSLVSSNYKAPFAYPLGKKPHNRSTPVKPPGFPDPVVSRNNSFQPERTLYDRYAGGPAENMGSPVNEKKFHSMPDISLLLPRRDSLSFDWGSQLNNSTKYGTLGPKMYDQSLYSGTSYRPGTPFIADDFTSMGVGETASYRLNSESPSFTVWSTQPFEQSGVADIPHTVGGEGVGSRQHSITPETDSAVDFEAKLLQSLRHCIVKLLKLEGSDWLFQQNGGFDEDLIDRAAAREKFLYEAETKEMNRGVQMGESQFLVTSVPNCGEGCIWRVDLVISFGVWCIHRVLELSLTESRPELWGKYTYVLNRLQGIIDLAFSKSHAPMNPCFCLQLPASHQQRSSPPISNGCLPPTAKQGKGKCTTASSLLDIIKDVEIAISCRKGRTGTAAGDVAFPKGKENLASVLKRYKRRLSSKPAGNTDGLSGPRNASSSALYG